MAVFSISPDSKCTGKGGWGLSHHYSPHHTCGSLKKLLQLSKRGTGNKLCLGHSRSKKRAFGVPWGRYPHRVHVVSCDERNLDLTCIAYQLLTRQHRVHLFASGCHCIIQPSQTSVRDAARQGGLERVPLFRFLAYGSNFIGRLAIVPCSSLTSTKWWTRAAACGAK